jgi:hypothetical protein
LLCEKETHTNRVGENFLRKFPFSFPSGDTISKLLRKVRTNGILIDKKPLQRNRVLTEENLDKIGHRLETSPRRSL